MFNLKIHSGDWVAVCDGAKALILEIAGDEHVAELEDQGTHEHDDLKTSENGTDAPGRSFNSADGRPSAMEQTDWHDQAEQRFLADRARLDAALARPRPNH